MKRVVFDCFPGGRRKDESWYATNIEIADYLKTVKAGQTVSL